MFTKKQTPVTIESKITELLEKSAKTKSVFAQMKSDLEDTNTSIEFATDELEERMNELIKLKDSLTTEHTVNENVIDNIDKLLS